VKIWIVRQRGATMRVKAPSIGSAIERAASCGFVAVDSIVLSTSPERDRRAVLRLIKGGRVAFLPMLAE